MFAVEAASAPAVVGASVAPNADATMLIPALAYSAFLADLVDAGREAQLLAWSTAPWRVRKDSATTL